MTNFASARYRKGTIVHVEGDSSVGIPSWKGRVLSDDGEYVTVSDVDDKNNFEEIPKRFVWSEKELKDRDTQFHKALQKRYKR